MKIIHITSMHEFDDDRIFQRACIGLKNKNIEVGIIAQHSSDNIFMYEGVKVYPLKERKGIKRRLLSSIQAFRLAVKHKADIYHFHDPDLMFFMTLLSLLGKNVVYDIHELYRVRFYQWKFIPNFFRNILAKFYQNIEHLFIRTYSGFTLPSESMFKLWYKNVKKPYSVIRNIHLLSSISKFDLTNNEDNRKFLIYTSGVNGPDRRNKEILKAFSILYKKYPDVELLFAGFFRPKGFDKELQELASSLGIKDRFSMEGFLPYEDQFKRSVKASLGLVLLEPNEKNYIATSNRMFEYMFCKLPILCEALPEPMSVIDKVGCGYYLNSENIEELAEKMEYFYKNRLECLKMGNKGNKAVLAEYHYEEDLKLLIRLYQKILS